MTSTSASKPKFVRLVGMREEGDCVVAVLATYLGTTYEVAAREAARAVPQFNGRNGMTTGQIKKVAFALGSDLKLKRAGTKTWSLLSKGILVVKDHVVLLWNGSIWDPNSSLWDASHYLAHYNYEPLGLLVDETKVDP